MEHDGSQRVRLQKFMADLGVASRRKCEEYIKDGRVRVNSQVAVIGAVVDPDNDIVELDSKRINTEVKREIIMFNKPRGVICSASDPRGRATVMDFFKEHPVRLYNVGRLDYDSEGLLIMTNDGELAYKMMHPKFIVDKTYYVICRGEISDKEIKALTEGVELDDGITAPATVSNIRDTRTGKTSFLITIHEGRNRQIRRMMDSIGHETLLLRRVRIGNLRLGMLKSGEWRRLTADEESALRRMLK